jgi:hypothetical protein
MSTLITKPNRNGLEALATQGAPLPAPRVDVQVRPATLDDFDFLDRLQTAYSKQLGYMPRKQLEGKIELGHVLVAEGVRSQKLEDRRPEPETGTGAQSELLTSNSQLLTPGAGPTPVGFIIGCDRYFKRDDCGIIYQLCVEPGQRRSLVGAMLVKAMFDRAAYGCRLFCCWCAQDIEANRFWESLGFVPLAYRAGSEKKKGLRGAGRIHIFWQKRIRPGDDTTPWWFPAKTDAGSMREDRLVLPIAPGMHWSDQMPLITPAQSDEPSTVAASLRDAGVPQSRAKPTAPKLIPGMIASPQEPTPHPKKRIRASFGPPPIDPPSPPPAATDEKPEAPKVKRAKRKADPKLITAARELRDRWLEKVNEDPSLILPAPKYDVARELPDEADRRHAVPRLLGVEVKALPDAA